MKNKDPLEEFILSNRESFDNFEVPDRVWNGVNAEVNTTAKIKPLRIVWASLAACFLMMIGCLFFYGQSNTSQNVEMASMELNEELPEMKSYYSRQVSDKFNALKGFDLDGTIKGDLNQSDEFLKELEIELKEVPASKKEAVMEAMIKNYQYKLMLLDRVLIEINKSKNKEDGNSISI